MGSDGSAGVSLPESDLVPRPPRRRFWRWVVNGWLLLHVTAVIVAPSSVDPASPLIQSAWELFHPYLQVLYLNHGYHFFAPEPGESTLVAFAAEREDGTIIRGRFPDRAIQPRLLYHRHFMLSEHMAITRPELQEQWCRSFAKHIGRKYGAVRVGLTRQTHLLPTMEMVRNGVLLDDPSSYTEQPLGMFPCDEL